MGPSVVGPTLWGVGHLLYVHRHRLFPDILSWVHFLHRHSNSMDGFTTLSFDIDSVMVDDVNKTTGPDRLAELALIDPKRAKRCELSCLIYPFYLHVSLFGHHRSYASFLVE